jgi:hypothetical protein
MIHRIITIIIIIKIIIINMLIYAGTSDCFTHLRALFGTPSTAAFWPTQLALLGIIPPAVIHIIIVTQGWVVNGVRRHAEPLGDNDPPQLCVF